MGGSVSLWPRQEGRGGRGGLGGHVVAAEETDVDGGEGQSDDAEM